MYNHTNQYRCIIIRGKSQKELDNLLPAYALVIDDICPCAREEFENRFNGELARILHGKNADTVALKKTLDNHRTEIAGKLFGMYYLAADDVYYASERTKKFIADSDQPAFFKDICYKMQFPNGMNKIQTVRPYLEEQKKNNVIVIHNESNKGFSNNINLGMSQSQERDVILLNSDTIVTKNWVEKMVACAYSDSSIGTVTPLSNNATLCSVPNFCEENTLPEGMSVDQMANIVEERNREGFRVGRGCCC